MTETIRSLPRWSLHGVRQGALMTVPLIPGIVVFAAAFGTLAAQRGLTLAEATLMSALVYSGAGQLVAIEAWQRPLTTSVVLALAVLTATVSLRFVLMGASLRPWLGPLPAWQSYGALAFLVDANWLLASRYRQDGGDDAGIFFGAGVALWVVWVAATVPGYLLGVLISNPWQFGLDFVMPAFFSAMLVPLWRGARMGGSWVIAAVVALLTSMLIGGWWFVIVGALAGSIAAGFMSDESDDPIREATSA